MEKRAVKQLTRDHTLVQNLIDRGELSVEEAEHHPKKHYITRAIGVGDTLDIDYQMYELKKESVVLLCTDGLSNYLKLEKLPELLKSCIRKGSLQELIDYANNAGRIGQHHSRCAVPPINARFAGGNSTWINTLVRNWMDAMRSGS